MTKILIVCFIMFSLGATAQNQFQFDADAFRLELNSYSILKNKSVLDYNNKLSNFEVHFQHVTFYDIQSPQQLFSALENYSLVTDNLNNIISVKAIFDKKNLGKRFFDDHYEAYQNTLSNFLPQVPDANCLFPIY